MTNKEALHKIRNAIKSGMRLDKCRKCGCMKDALENCRRALPLLKGGERPRWRRAVKSWLSQMKTVEYTCFGCRHCFGAEAANDLEEAFPSGGRPAPAPTVRARRAAWPPEPGEYFSFPRSPGRSVAVSTLGSTALPEVLAKLKPEGLAIAGKTETENTGIDKLIKNTITNPAIRYLVVAGTESGGHLSGHTLLALAENGVAGDMRVTGSPGRRPVLRNVSPAEVEAFRRQVQVVNMIGCGNARIIAGKIGELAKKKAPSRGCAECAALESPLRIPVVQKVKAGKPKILKMDKAGYFVVIPANSGGIIIVEHYGYDNKLLHVIEGKAASIYPAIIDKGWLSELSHAAYLGRELARAELCMKHGIKYVQDKAPGKVAEGAQ